MQNTSEIQKKINALLAQRESIQSEIHGLRAMLHRAKRSKTTVPVPEIPAFLQKPVPDDMWKTKGMAGEFMTPEEIEKFNAWVRQSNPAFAGHKNPETK